MASPQHRSRLVYNCAAEHYTVDTNHGFIYTTAGCITDQSHNSESCHSQGAIIGAKSVYILIKRTT